MRRIGWLLAALLATPLAHAGCFEQAAAYQQVNARVLKAIAWQESRARPQTVHRNANGSIDYGQMQINSIHLRRLSQFGVSVRELMDPCESTYVAAWHLRQMMNKYGNSWAAVGAYHSETPAERDRYARSVRQILESDQRFARFERSEPQTQGQDVRTARADVPADRAQPQQPKQAPARWQSAVGSDPVQIAEQMLRKRPPPEDDRCLFEDLAAC
ncbi:lytic transglycosylase domain-containing protein [Xanthomonas translucens pv. graminis]|jgi:soluble lytic murein transglycosylase-like protein|uniref:Hpa2 protein n=1 Tax=Xanthomonas graminis pv. graminis TaxID=134874 RepID=A0A1M4IE61_9XANT|nr:Membrane-bound lytic murein transglycosylase F n1 [Xanthomonas translucens pv. graminis ART-Xtg29]OAX61408.1 lytic murein transglycosylase [Xanthomonas translucens pv. graminis]UKE53493.1 lytic transglycosylase domain-containing protein [Xanthomonas translucens pv. graminis]WIH07811.1 lytic transglycosylase domain-containing protein [Xanthomonas translucens pv. graminis]WIH13431.1 lytic transglycosylase domain-containing protein [Xanthomonas translucens pv. graminis]